MYGSYDNNNNHFNHPSLNKKDTMYLNDINDADEKIRKFKSINTNRDFSYNLFNLDIEKSCPNRHYLIHKPCFINKNNDIEGSQPSNFTNLFLNKRNDFNLNISDIENTNPTLLKTYDFLYLYLLLLDYNPLSQNMIFLLSIKFQMSKNQSL